MQRDNISFQLSGKIQRFGFISNKSSLFYLSFQKIPIIFIFITERFLVYNKSKHDNAILTTNDSKKNIA